MRCMYGTKRTSMVANARLTRSNLYEYAQKLYVGRTLVNCSLEADQKDDWKGERHCDVGRAGERVEGFMIT